MKRKRRVGFVIEQALGHVAYGMGLKQALAARDDLEMEWLEIPYEPGSFGKLPLVGKNWTLRGSTRAHRAIAAAHARRPLDALFIHTQTIGLFCGPHMAKIPTMLSLDATPMNYDELAGAYGDTVGSAPLERLKLGAHKLVMKRAKAFTTWSEWAKASLVRHYGAKPSQVTVVHPGTVLSNFPDPVARKPRAQGPLRILFVGGDFRRKGGDLLLETVRRHLHGRAELHLVTGADVTPGDGVYVYKGLKPHSPELLRRFAEADVFALPTRGDCLAVVLGEAMASCLPIITTRVGAHAEAVEDGKSGFLIDRDDAGALRDRLERLERDPALAFDMGQRSREVGEAGFDMHKNANRLAELLLGMAASS